MLLPSFWHFGLNEKGSSAHGVRDRACRIADSLDLANSSFRSTFHALNIMIVLHVNFSSHIRYYPGLLRLVLFPFPQFLLPVLTLPLFLPPALPLHLFLLSRPYRFLLRRTPHPDHDAPLFTMTSSFANGFLRRPQ